MKKQLTAIAAAAAVCTCFTGCGNAAKTYTDYVQAVLDVSYMGITAEYMEMTDSTQEEADAVYQDEVDYLVQLICYNYDVVTEYVNEGTMTGYEALAKDLLKKCKYTVQDAVKSGSAYHITVVCEPVDFWEISTDAVNDYYNNEFAEKYESATEDQLEALEAEYAVEVLNILNPLVGQVGYKDPVNKIVEITVDDDGTYGISDQDWLDIDDLLLDMNLNT